jgi:hypothetical protein
MAETPQELDARTRLAEALFDDPETRPLLEEAIAKKFPDKAKAVLPGREVRLQGQQMLDQLKKERDAFAQEMEQERQRKNLEAERDKIRAQGIRDDEIPEVEKIMTGDLIGKHEVAAELYRTRQQQVAAPRSIYSTMDVPGLRGNHGEEFKGVNGGPSIIADRDVWARQMADQIVNDFAKNPQQAGKRWG